MIKKEKNKNIVKKRLILGASSILVITVCGTIGWKVIKSTDLAKEGEIVEHSFLTGYDVQNSYSDTEISDAELFSDPATCKQVDSCLAALGFGYTSENLITYYRDNEYANGYDERLEELDRIAYDAQNEGYISDPDRFYMWCNNIKEEDRPEYVLKPTTEIILAFENVSVVDKSPDVLVGIKTFNVSFNIKS